jgi:hypothetical protein
MEYEIRARSGHRGVRPRPRVNPGLSSLALRGADLDMPNAIVRFILQQNKLAPMGFQNWEPTAVATRPERAQDREW